MAHTLQIAAASLAVGIVVGVGYALIGLRSPAPPIVALLGLLGMVAGEQTAGALLAKWHARATPPPGPERH